jgi:hypothetical protein
MLSHANFSKIIMKTKIILLSAFLFSLVPAGALAQQIQPAVLSAPGGRYVLGQISSARADQNLLDTQSGRVWQVVVDTNNADILQEVPYKSVDGSLSLLPPDAQLELQNAVQASTNGQQAVDEQQPTQTTTNTAPEPVSTAH